MARKNLELLGAPGDSYMEELLVRGQAVGVKLDESICLVEEAK